MIHNSKGLLLLTVTKIVLVFLLILNCFLPLFSTIFVKADQDFSFEHTINFENPKFYLVELNNTEFIKLSISDCMSIDEPGIAQLPFYTVHILIPDSCCIEKIEVSKNGFHDYSKSIESTQIIPAQEEKPFSIINENHFQKNQTWYELSSFLPEVDYDSLGVNYMNGYPVETIHLYPIKYHPSNNQLHFYKKLELNIVFSYHDSSLSSSSNRFFRKQNNDANKVKELIINSNMIDSYSLDNDSANGNNNIPLTGGKLSSLDDAYIGGICDSINTYTYVIVTNNELKNANSQEYNWSDLINHRFERDNFNGKIVTIEEINQCSDYYNETSVFNDSAAQLREFCKDAYLDWNTEYILLGGNWQINNETRQIVPCRIMTDRDQEEGYDTMPSDLYFSNLDGDWYYDSENIWGGGKSGANDKLSELSVGRIPVWNAEMVSNSVKKIIWYDNCNDELFLRSSGFLGGDLGWVATSKQYMEEIRVGDGSFSEYVGFEEWNTQFSTYEINTNSRYYDADYPSESAAINAWKIAINNNELCLISHIDHGSQTNTLSLGEGNGLSNTNYFLGTSQACLSGRFSSGESGASTFLSKWDDNGAFAMLLNTGYGYGSGSSTAGKSQLQHKIFWNYFFENQTTDFKNWRLGQAMQYTKNMFSSNIDFSHTYSYVWYSWNLFGDPAQQIRLIANEHLPPQINSTDPIDTNNSVSLNLSELTANIYDVDNDTLNWTIETSPSIGNATGENESIGEKTCFVSNLSYFTEYTWFVNVSDGSFWTNETFTFITDCDPKNELPFISNINPINKSELVDLWLQNVSVTINDSNEDLLSCTIQGCKINNCLYTNQSNGSINTSCITPLPANTTVTWFVNVSDDNYYPVEKYFVFTTRDQYTPTVPNMFCVKPMNRTAVRLNWTKNSSADYTIIERNTTPFWEHGEGIQIYNGSKNSTIDTNLYPGTTYYYQAWGWNTTDHLISDQNRMANTTTKINNPVLFSNPIPSNNSINQSLNLTWSIIISDEETDKFNWSIRFNESFVNTSNLDSNGTKSINLRNLTYYTFYNIYVNATDGFNTTNEWFQFQTTLPNDTTDPIIESTQISSLHPFDGSDIYDWNHIQCNVTDNFKVAQVYANISFSNNCSMNYSLIYDQVSDSWINDTLHIDTDCNITILAYDYNGNMNSTTIESIQVIPRINLNDKVDISDYSSVSKNIDSLQTNILTIFDTKWNYTMMTSPDIGKNNGNTIGNETITLSVTGIMYESTYYYICTFSNDTTSFFLNLSFTTEDTSKEDTNINNHPGSGGNGGFLPPASLAPEEEELNLPPEPPLPPQGPFSVEQGVIQTYMVSGWDTNNDTIRFQLDYGNGSLSEWSTFVASNETVEFSLIFTKLDNYELSVRAQDENGLNSSWSERFTVFVSSNNNSLSSQHDEINTEINNETGEIIFTYDTDTKISENTLITWDFGDGTIKHGLSPTHTYLDPGEYQVTITLTDENGNETMKTFIVTIPEPEQNIDTSSLVSTTHSSLTHIPWIIILIGIIVSILAMIIVVHLKI